MEMQTQMKKCKKKKIIFFVYIIIQFFEILLTRNYIPSDIQLNKKISNVKNLEYQVGLKNNNNNGCDRPKYAKYANIGAKNKSICFI